ncbi:MAG TPA: FtsX-like permease family protein, partial [Vicinamibacterales bacterium]|nr:FtsX-like permease family protein [Vicinamibacterales bacterium]
TLITGAQVAMACVLLVGASLLGRSFVALVSADRGYDPEGVLTARLSLPDSRYSPERRYTVVEQLLDRVSAMPDVAAAAFTSDLPLTPGGSTAAFTMHSRALEASTISVQASPRIVSPQSFRALGLHVLAGRGFTHSDTDASPPVAIVNRAFSRRYAADAALGARVPMAVGYGMEGIDATVVGVIEDVQYPGTRQDAQPEIYYSFRQLRGELRVPVVTLVLRTYGDPQRAADGVRAAIHVVDPTLAPDMIATLEDRVLTSLARPRLYAAVLGGFAVFALVIAGVGLFGVLSYSVAQRSHEIGVRAALGASPARIVSMVLGQGLLVTSAGALIGVFAALLLVRTLSAFLYGVAPYDRLTFVLVPIVLLAAAALACVVPARRAARVDPLRVLRAG